MLFSLLDESDSDEESLNEDSSEHSSVKVYCNTSMERFSAKLRRLRGTIYQKIGKRKILNTDLDKYEQLVGQFVRKFGDRELSKWEVWIWQKKVVKTRTDAFNASFDDHLEVSENLSDVSNLELSLQNHDRNDGVKIHEPRAKNSVDEFFGKQRFLKDFLENLPCVSNAEDHKLEKRLNSLRDSDETDDSKATKVDNPESLGYKAFVKNIMTPIQAKDEFKVEESRTKDPIVKDIKREPADGFDDKTDTSVK